MQHTNKRTRCDTSGDVRANERGKARAADSSASVSSVPAAAPWPNKALPSLDPTLQPYAFPYGPAALIDERNLVCNILELAHSIRMPNLKWPSLTAYYNNQGIGLLGMTISSDEAFVDSEDKRNLLVDRVHHFFNVDCKMEVQAMTSNPNDGMSETKRQSMRVVHYHLTEDHLYDTVNKIDRLRSLFDSLKPETVDLIRRCTTHKEIKRSMLVTYRPQTALFFQDAPQW